MSVAIGETQATFCETVIDELVRAGLTDAVICPGSRSTPMTMAIARSELRSHVRLDERSAGFFALGLARRTRRAVVVVVTSGTAAAELHAAVAEASLDDVPLVVITADRPPELHHIGAAQTIPQGAMFGELPRFSFDPGSVIALPEPTWRSIANRLWLEATGLTGPPGPVHANLGFVDPLIASSGPLPEGRPDGAPWATVQPVTANVEHAIELVAGQRGVIIAGEGAGSPDALAEAATRLGFPVLADPRSGLGLVGGGMIRHGDSILRADESIGDLWPDVVILAGAPPASKVLSGWVAASSDRGARIVCLGLHGPRRHATRVPATFVIAAPDSLWTSIPSTHSADPTWRDLWESRDQVADATIDQFLGKGALCEPGVARLVAANLGPATTLMVSSSMPLRDLEWYAAAIDPTVAVLSNRGANGIDGVVSTAIGAAAAGEGPVVCLLGDLAFLHDVSALVDGVEGDGSVTLVVADNGGGGIFSFLPQRAALDQEVFEVYFGTPRQPSLVDVAGGFGHGAVLVTSEVELTDAMATSIGSPGITVIVCALPGRDENVAIHDKLNSAIARAIGAGGG